MVAPLVVAGRALVWRRLRRVLIAVLPIVLAGGLAIMLLVAMAGGSGQQQAPSDSVGGCPGAAMDAVNAAGGVAGLTDEQSSNVRTIVAVGRELKVPAYGWVIAVATAMQESHLVNVPFGDRDSVGLFQQRTAWGSTAQRMDPAASARMFYTGGHQGQPGLLDISGFDQMSVTDAAQSVQRSAFPGAYAKWQPLALQVVGDPTVLSAACYANASFLSDGTAGGKALAAALAEIGLPYSWGGGTVSGPSVGFGAGAGVVGFDCSSLVQYAWHQVGVDLPRLASAQAASVTRLPSDPKAWRAGDLVFLHTAGDPPDYFHHVAMYDGQGGIVHAPRPGLTVEVVHNFLSVDYYKRELAFVGRVSQRAPRGTGTANRG